MTDKWRWRGAFVGAALVGGAVIVGGLAGYIADLGSISGVFGAVLCAAAGGVIGGLWHRRHELIDSPYP